MASTTFTSGTPVTKEWLNDVNTVAYGSSAISNSASFWPDVTSDVQMHRMAGRLFVYDGVAFTGNFTGTQSGFVATSSVGANWASRDSAFFAASKRGLMAVTGFTSNENMPTGAPTETIGVAGFVIGKQASKSVWGLYSDVQYEAGTSGWGVEFAVKNKSGVDLTATPYFFVSGACGIWLPAGGDSSYGGAPTNPNNFAIGVGANSSTWNKGLIFFATGLTRDGSGYATAIELAEKHRIVWRTSGNNTGFDLRSEVTGASANIAQVVTDNTITYYGTGVAPIFAIAHNSSGINYLRINNASNTNLPSIVAAGGDTDIGIQLRTKGTQAIRFQSQNSGTADEFRVGGINSSPVNFLWAYGTNSGQQAAVLGASGTDSNIDIVFTPKGTGTLKFGTWTSNADAAINGYVTIKDSAGNTRKLATIA